MAGFEVPPTENIGDETSTATINQWLRHLGQGNTSYRIFPQLVAFYSHSNKQNYLDVCPDEDKDECRACSTIPTLLNAFPGVGSAAIVASDTRNVVENWKATRDNLPSMWHAAVVCRLQRKLYIFDPKFRMDTPLGLQLRSLPGISNVRRVVLEMGKKDLRVDEIRITGIGDEEQHCLRSCCQWLEKLAKGERRLDEEEWYSVRR